MNGKFCEQDHFMNSASTEKIIFLKTLSYNETKKVIGNRSLSLPMPSGRHNVIGELFLGLTKRNSTR
ncbi:MAG: hypothetical protein DWQ02_22255 [Bacteroidetes bacterium]|nr:MAG: hypothetical protein DWQ02_22255 [Bacteroidota bacterium]